MANKKMCEVCGDRHAYYQLNDNLGNKSEICRVCRPIFTSKALQNELSLQLKYFLEYTRRYQAFLQKEETIQYRHHATAGFEASIEKMLNRLTMITNKKQIGRIPKAPKKKTKTHSIKHSKKKTWQQKQSKKN